ncbi:SRPBCC family protein [Methylorubrum extorquens]|uniref:SRPBCC family protein n=1 Tax=Methylorubrum extorquens TaxID=408 RepID=UPI002238A9D2|nr:SRPBCC family protein [Methylorubrum extorquens]UYW26950.1 SRPBCC domain-containing protein [Methylorubrum extorquens]UYW33183.1 SRPBCC domain-containing protein [Methylorubrum extorquens]
MMTDTEPAVVLVRTFRATCDKLYQAWTDPVMIQRWLAPGPNVVEQAETDLRVGGRFRLQTRGPDGAEHRISGCYRELEPARRIVQTWIYDGPLDLLRGEETLLQIEFTPRDNGTSDMRLTHKRIARADIREAYREDWPSCFDKLAPLLH